MCNKLFLNIVCGFINTAQKQKINSSKDKVYKYKKFLEILLTFRCKKVIKKLSHNCLKYRVKS